VTVRVGNITFDCENALVVGTFWALALGRELDPGADAGFCSIGRGDAARTEPAWFFEMVPETKTTKNRVHLDMVDADAAAVEWLVTLGASIIEEHTMGGQHWTVMSDPEGNEFCIASTSYVG
jgi:hypothetical protein